MNSAGSPQEFVESAGLYFERLGLNRTSGRILGLLLVSSESSAGAPSLCAELAVAKSSMSVALRQLEGTGLVERYRPPRERRDRYRLTEDVFGRAFQAKMTEFGVFRTLVAQGLRAVGDDPAPKERLLLMSDMCDFMAREFPKLLVRWDRAKRARGG